MSPDEAQRLQRIEEKLDHITEGFSAVRTHVWGYDGQGGMNRAFAEHQASDTEQFQEVRETNAKIQKSVDDVKQSVTALELMLRVNWKWIVGISTALGALFHLAIDWIHKAKP